MIFPPYYFIFPYSSLKIKIPFILKNLIHKRMKSLVFLFFPQRYDNDLKSILQRNNMPELFINNVDNKIENVF